MTNRAQLQAVFREVLPALDPGSALARALVRSGHRLSLGNEWQIDLDALRRVLVVAIGKAALPMTRVAADLLAGREQSGLCIVPPGTATVTAVGDTVLLEGGHPLPDAGSLTAGARALDLLAQAGPDDLVLFLVSGGGSALLEASLFPEVSLDDLRALHALLVGSGAGIGEINAVRKHFSAVKGGRLAAACAAAQQLTLLVSDVPPGDPSAVASGPTMPDPSTWQDAREVLDRHDLGARLSPGIQAVLGRAQAELPETPKAGHPAFRRAHWRSLLDSGDALAAAQAQCEARGWSCFVADDVDEQPVESAASAMLARARREKAARPDRTVCVLAAGEVGVRLPADPGTGGRNQQFALECALQIEGQPVTVLSAGTDGVDGNSPAAGAVADGTTVARARAAGRDAAASARAFDAHPLFTALGDAVTTGPTGTNLRDLRMIVLAVLLLLTAACCAVPATDAPAVDLAAADGTTQPPSLEVRLDGRLVARAIADFDPARPADTCKVFHHLFAADGRLLTKGTGGSFPHHRGLFVGWNQVQANGRRWDFWHCGGGETQRLAAQPEPATAGLGPGWQVLAIDWRDGDGAPVLREQRALRATAQGDDTVVLDIDLRLAAASGPVQLAGDPHHAGVQIRALQAFAEEGAATLQYRFPETARDRGNDVYSDAGWAAAVLPMADGEVTVLHLDAPSNPRPIRYSARPYGRFGSTFSQLLQPGSPLHLRYRVVIALGARDADWCEAEALLIQADPEGR